MDTAGNIRWEDYIVHLPLPQMFGEEKALEKARLLEHVRYLLVVGSLLRPRRVAQLAGEALGLRHVGSYFNILDDPHISDREFNVEVVDLGLDEPVHVAIASHGIGASGAEIAIGELRALILHARQLLGHDGEFALCGVGRSGTRGTLGRQEYGTVGISTASFNDELEVALPDPLLLEAAVDAARDAGHPYALGPGISTQYFWTGQGRVLPTQRREPPTVLKRRIEAAQAMLWNWVERGITFVEMEDHAVHRVCRGLGIPSVSAGAIIARRYDEARGEFILDYDAEAKHRSELWPAEVMLRAFGRHWRSLAAQGGPETLLGAPAGEHGEGEA